MTDETKELINLQLQVLRNTLIENRVSMYLDAEGRYIGFFDTDKYLHTKKIIGIKVSIDDLLAEINELKEIKWKYESVLKDKQRMSDLLYELMSEKYDNLSYEERLEWHKKEMCNHCRYYGCGRKLADDIGCVLPSDKAWIPSRVCCKNFDWN